MLRLAAEAVRCQTDKSGMALTRTGTLGAEAGLVAVTVPEEVWGASSRRVRSTVGAKWPLDDAVVLFWIGGD